MKRYFCDQCGEEFQYTDKSVKQSNDFTQTFLFPAQSLSKQIIATVTLNVKAFTRTRRSIETPHRHYRNYGDREQYTYESVHADLCGACRWKAIDQLRGDPDALSSEIKWDDPSRDDAFNPPD